MCIGLAILETLCPFGGLFDMSQKLTSKQERFCQLVAAGGGLTESYRGAGYSTQNMKPNTVNRNAKLLADSNKISTRIEALQEKHAKRHEITVDDLVAELEEARRLSVDIEQPSSMVSATMGKGKLLGLVVDKTDNRHTVDLSSMSDAELKAIIERAAK